MELTLQVGLKGYAYTFEALGRRWMVECALAWISTNRGCARNYGRLAAASHEAAVQWAMISVMAQRLAAERRPDA